MEVKVGNLKYLDRHSSIPLTVQIRDRPASVKNVIDVRLWLLMQDCLFDARSRNCIKPLRLPDDIQELASCKDWMLDDEDSEMVGSIASLEVQPSEGNIDPRAEIEEVMMDHSEEDSYVSSFIDIDSEQFSEVMMDDALDENTYSSLEGSFEHLKATSDNLPETASRCDRRLSGSRKIPCEWFPCQENNDPTIIMGNSDSEEMLDEMELNIESQGYTFLDAVRHGEQRSHGDIGMVDEDEILDNGIDHC